MEGWDPETAVSERPHVTILRVALPRAVQGSILKRNERTYIFLQLGLSPEEERCTLAEQLIRDEQLALPDLLADAEAPEWLDLAVARARELRQTRQAALRRLLPDARLFGLIRPDFHACQMRQAAHEAGVTEDRLRERLLDFRATVQPRLRSLRRVARLASRHQHRIGQLVGAATGVMLMATQLDRDMDGVPDIIPLLHSLF